MERHLFLAVLGASLIATPSRGAAQLHSFLVSGFQAPGASAGVAFSYFDTAYINSSGEVSFSGTLSNNRKGIWSTGSGSFASIAIQNNPAPVNPARNFTTVLLGGIGDDGSTGFTGFLTGSTGSISVFAGLSGAIQSVARIHTTAPSLPSGWTFSSVCSPSGSSGVVSSPGISSNGSAAFYASAVDGANNESRFGIWSNRSGVVNPIIMTDDTAPDYPVGAIISGIGHPQFSFVPKVNGLGNVAFTASVAGPGIASNEQAVFVENQGAMQAVARKSIVPIGVDPTTTFLGFEDPSLNNAGRVAFVASLTGPGVTAANNSGIWSTSNGVLHKVAREGDAAPGATPGAVFSSFGSRTEISGDHRVLVHGSLSGPGIDATRDSGLWMERSGILEMVFQEGMQVPDLAPGVVFKSVEGAITGYAMNSTGYLVFRHRFGNVDGTDSGEAIFSTDPLGNLETVVRTGQSIEALPGQFKTISSFALFGFNDFSGGQDGGTPFNDSAQLVLPVTYSDGTTGILIATVPEPGYLGFMFTMALFARRRGNARCTSNRS